MKDKPYKTFMLDNGVTKENMKRTNNTKKMHRNDSNNLLLMMLHYIWAYKLNVMNILTYRIIWHLVSDQKDMNLSLNLKDLGYSHSHTKLSQGTRSV